MSSSFCNPSSAPLKSSRLKDRSHFIFGGSALPGRFNRQVVVCCVIRRPGLHETRDDMKEIKHHVENEHQDPESDERIERSEWPSLVDPK